jgi:aspartyl aminopeptidase
VALVVQGQRPLSAGLRIVGSHIDSPRLDLKPYPIYEDTDLTFLKTHYYGGIKKYQWLARPLALHGVVLKAGGEAVSLVIGEDPGEPVFTVLDLLPHLARKAQMDKKVADAFEGEKLNVLAGSLPLGNDDTKERFKLHFLKLLEERYGLTEEDFISAEVEVVPAGPARDLGWDRSLVGAYGQDDRACAYAELATILDVQEPEHTCVALFYDKEETGSEGSTSARACLLEEVVELLLERQGESPLGRRRVLLASRALSADVTGATPTAWAMGSACINTGAAAANITPARPTPNTSPGSARSFRKTASSGRRASWARWMKAAAAPSPSTWPSTAWR